jgi:proteasome lid subunit RPN8/RPN11
MIEIYNYQIKTELPQNLTLDKEPIITSGCLEKLLTYGKELDAALRQANPQLQRREETIFAELGGILLAPSGAFAIENCTLVPCRSSMGGASYSADNIEKTIETARKTNYEPVGWFHFHPGESKESCYLSGTDKHDIGIRFNDIQVPLVARWTCECGGKVLKKEALGIYSIVLTANGAYKTHLSIDELFPYVVHYEVKPKVVTKPLEFSNKEIRKEIVKKVELDAWYSELIPNLDIEEALIAEQEKSPSLWHFVTQYTGRMNLRRFFKNDRRSL